MAPETPRIPGLDRPWAEQLMGYLEPLQRAQASAFRQPGEAPDQISSAFFAGYSLDLASLYYALGLPLGRVRALLEEAAGAYRHLFAQRGSTPAFPVEQIVVGPETPDGGRDLSERGDLNPPGTRDHSLTNSRNGLAAMHLNLLVAGRQVAEELASLVWDPEGASYIGPNSELCTPDDQHLAYALKAYLQGAPDDCRRELESIGSNAPGFAFQSELLRALLRVDGNRFTETLTWYWDWCRTEQERDEIGQDLEAFLPIPPLALLALALEEGCLEAPPPVLGLPLDLLARAEVRP